MAVGCSSAATATVALVPQRVDEHPWGVAEPDRRLDMAQGTCKASDCNNTGRLARGWCMACYAWSSHHNWQDPTGRPHKQKALAARFGVSRGTILDVVAHRTWVRQL